MRVICAPVLAAFGLALAAPAGAQNMDCAAIWNLARAAALANGSEITVASDQTPRFDGSRCLIGGISVGMSGPLSAEIGELSWSGDGWNRIASEGLPPFNAHVTASDIRFVPEVGDPVQNYLMREQSSQSGIDVEFIAGWDLASKGLEITHFRVDFPGENFAQYRLAVSDVDLTDANSLRAAAGTASLDNVWLHVRTNGFFEQYILLPLGGALLAGSVDPEADIEELKRQGIANLARLPSDMFPPSTKAAFSELIGDMPHPRGDVEIHMRAEPGLSIGRFIRLANNQNVEGVDSVLDLLDGVRYQANYTRTGAPD